MFALFVSPLLFNSFCWSACFSYLLVRMLFDGFDIFMHDAFHVLPDNTVGCLYMNWKLNELIKAMIFRYCDKSLFLFKLLQPRSICSSQGVLM